ncbi:MAG: DUF6884 domain-containing protein [Pyrinomonadaceae bacterium]
MRSLLLVACSRRKRRTRKLLPAIERYDGGAYRVIRKAQREGSIRRKVDIKIISAKFGLIDGMTAIPFYEQRMTKRRARDLKPRIQRALRMWMSLKNYSEVYVDLGHDYVVAIEGWTVHPGITLLAGSGRIGERLRDLKRWLANSG